MPVGTDSGRGVFRQAKQQLAERNAFRRAKEMLAAITGAKGDLDILAGLAYKSRGKGRGTPSRRYGNACNNGGLGRPHQNMQEKFRRVFGGWALVKTTQGMTKRQYFNRKMEI